MSWSSDITASTEIQEKDIDDIVEGLPERLSHKEALSRLGLGLGLKIKQPWGWSCGTDICLPEGKRLTVRGAGYSAHLAEEMIDYVKKELRNKGYKNVRNSRID